MAIRYSARAGARGIGIGSLVLWLMVACGGERPAARDASSAPQSVRQIQVRAHGDLIEGSGAALSTAQPGVWFTTNDSRHGPTLFALDTLGAARGHWRVARATNIDWEAVALGPCTTNDTLAAGERASCLYIADVGDNDEVRPSVALYQLPEPEAREVGATRGEVTAQILSFRYEDGPHDVEAMYVGPLGDVVLITKRPRRNTVGQGRPALVFTIPARAWTAGQPVVAMLTDSLPIVPGSAPGRLITDAALSADARHVVVRTYRDVLIFAADSATGRIDTQILPTFCSIQGMERGYGEGISWLGTSGDLLLTQEGRNAPVHIVRCRLPVGS